MSEETGPFREVQSAYTKRLVAASVCVAMAAASAHLLFSDTSHWVLALVTVCATTALGSILSTDVIQRYYQMRHQSLIAEAPKLYGYAGPEPVASAAEKLKRTRKPTPKDVH